MAGAKHKRSERSKSASALRSQDGGKERGEINPVVENDADTCKFCRKDFINAEDHMVICERCDQYICVSCAVLSSEEYSFMQRTKMLHWFCASCEKPALIAVKSEKLIEQKCSSMFVAFREEMEGQFARQFEALRTELGQMRAQVEGLRGEGNASYTVGGIGGSMKEQTVLISEVANESSREVAERERRKGNLIWFGIPESKASVAKDRMAADSEFVVDICQRALGVKLNVVSCRRLRTNEESNKCRPLLVTASDAAQTGLVLKEARKLRDSSEFRSIFVKKDATPLERAEMKKLIALRNQKREETKKQGGQEIWVVRNSRVIDVNRRQREGSHVWDEKEEKM